MKVRYGEEVFPIEDFMHRRFDEFGDKMRCSMTPKQQAMVYLISVFTFETVKAMQKRKVEELSICRFISGMLDPALADLEPVMEDDEDFEMFGRAVATFARIDDMRKPGASYEEVMGQPLPPKEK